MSDMRRGGYVFQKTKQCRKCSYLVYMFQTPRHREGPFVKTPRGHFVSHFAVCLDARHRYAETTYPGQGELFPVTP
jgi:hypothetical protein